VKITYVNDGGRVIARASFRVSDRTYHVESKACSTKGWALDSLADDLEAAAKAVRLAMLSVGPE